jgi:hypothetical protein
MGGVNRRIVVQVGMGISIRPYLKNKTKEAGALL